MIKTVTVRTLEDKLMKEVVTRLEQGDYEIKNHDIDHHPSVMSIQTDWLGRHIPTTVQPFKVTEKVTLKVGKYEVTIKRG